jgi:hypothetical protein
MHTDSASPAELRNTREKEKKIGYFVKKNMTMRISKKDTSP